MGAWGIGLYSSDFAMDLRGSVKAVARLPFTPDRLLEFLCAAEPAAANDPKDADYSIFWLTLADQFANRGIDCASARERALGIITSGADLAAMAARGLDERSLLKRRAMLEDLRRRISVPIDTAKSRRVVLKAPQKLLMAVGEVLAYPICKGKLQSICRRQGICVGQSLETRCVGRFRCRRTWAHVRLSCLVSPLGDRRASIRYPHSG
jgi:hypothetical protein